MPVYHKSTNIYLAIIRNIPLLTHVISPIYAANKNSNYPKLNSFIETNKLRNKLIQKVFPFAIGLTKQRKPVYTCNWINGRFAARKPVEYCSLFLSGCGTEKVGYKRRFQKAKIFIPWGSWRGIDRLKNISFPKRYKTTF